MKKSVEVGGFVSTKPGPLPSVRTHLIWMMLLCLLPGLVGGIFFLSKEYQDGRARIQLNTIQTARALVQAVDVQLAQGELLAQALATSDAMIHRDFAAFHRSAQRLAKQAQFAQGVVLYNRQGQQIVNTRQPWGQTLPGRINLEQIHSVFANGKPARPEVLPSASTYQPIVSVAVPVFSGEKVEYVLVVGIAPEIFDNLLAKQGLPPDWVAGVVDGKGIIAARNLLPEQFVGLKVSPSMLKYLLDAPEGSNEVTSLNGIPMVVPYSRSAQSGWSVAIGIPRNVLEADLKVKQLLFASGAILLMCISVGLAWHLGGRIAKSLLALRAPATALGNGESIALPQVHLREANEVVEAMGDAALMLRERNTALSVSHKALVEREAELTDSQRIAKLGSWSWDKHSDVLRASQETCRIFGLEHIPPFAQQDGLMFSHEAWMELNAAQMVTTRTGRSHNLEVPALHADGHAIWVNSRAEALYDADGKNIGLRGMVQDITERRRQASELNAMQTEMQTMMEWQVARHTVAALAHEINQPLASVSVLCEAAIRLVLADGLAHASEGERRQRIEQILQRLTSETERAGVVVRQLVKTVSQPDIALGPLALNALLHDVARTLIDEGAMHCQIHINCPVGLTPVNVNRLQISKVLINLISNAAQAMNSAQMSNGNIWIDASLATTGNMVTVSLRDEGPGIDAKMEREIFQPFVTTKSHGLGMGLTISRALVEAHGGRLWLETGSHTGALFHFTLPTSN